MLLTIFDMELDYDQLAVFQSGLSDPYNDWTPEQVQQGFVWREGSVSFGSVFGDGECRVTVRLGDELDVSHEAVLRAFVVPFTVENEGVEIGSIIDTVHVDIPPGRYGLMCSIVDIEELEWYVVSFVPDEVAVARVLKADGALQVPESLDLSGRAAL